jgi:tetratricopeptide (TPR) repeat protein
MARTIESAEMAVRESSSPADYQWARSTLAWVHCRAGEPQKDLAYLVGAVQKFRKAKANLFLVNHGTMRGEGYLLNHQYDEANQVLKATLKSAEKIGTKYYAGQCYFLLGEVSLKTDPAQEKAPTAATCFEKAITIHREIKAENNLALAYAGLGRYHKRKGDVAAARDYLNQALEIFERLGTLLEPDKVREELVQLSEA